MEKIEEQLISVYMPTKNRVDLIGRAVESVLNQTHKNLELIIVDDGSDTNQYMALLKKYGDHSKITILRNEVSKGACTSRNKAIKKASGKYITGIDDDDEWLPTRLELFFENRDCINHFSFIYADDYIFENTELKVYKKKSVFTIQEFLKKNIVGNQVFTYTERLIKEGFDPSMPSAQDYDCFMRLIKTYGLAKKIPVKTQILFADLSRNRITTSTSKFKGYFLFYKKYSNDMRRSTRKYQLFSLYQIRNKRLSLKTMLILFTLRNLLRLLK
jgi:glycosyltransferase involved in cell wall biosynthesis